jgi:hypothetical protein
MEDGLFFLFSWLNSGELGVVVTRCGGTWKMLLLFYYFLLPIFCFGLFLILSLKDVASSPFLVLAKIRHIFMLNYKQINLIK